MTLEGKHTLSPIFTSLWLSPLRVFSKLWSKRIRAEKKAAVLRSLKNKTKQNTKRLELRAGKVIGISVIE